MFMSALGNGVSGPPLPNSGTTLALIPLLAAPRLKLSMGTLLVCLRSILLLPRILRCRVGLGVVNGWINFCNTI
jgi:hypothetical protein